MEQPTERDPWTFFGTWSLKDKDVILSKLRELRVRFYVSESKEDEGFLRKWYSWDSSAEDPYVCYHLFIHNDDLELLGNFFVSRFPEREYLQPFIDGDPLC